MVNLILDPFCHCPHLKYLIVDNLYLTYIIEDNYTNSFYSNEEIKNIFKIDVLFEKNVINNQDKFDNIFIVIPILSLDKKHQSNYLHVISIYTNLLNNYKNKTHGKIVVFDVHDYDYFPHKCLENAGIICDYIFRRTYSKKYSKTYGENVYPYPFIMSTVNDPMYRLLNDNKLINNNKINKILWSGALYDGSDIYDEIKEEPIRKTLFENIYTKYNRIIDKKVVSNNSFLETLSCYKYILDMRGVGRLNKRFFEILTTNSLLMCQKMDIVWPFNEGDNFSDECFYENEDELYNNYLKLENDNELYNKCLKNQLYIANKYFNNNFLWNYIKNIINN
jgi:hypothetical protein